MAKKKDKLYTDTEMTVLENRMTRRLKELIAEAEKKLAVLTKQAECLANPNAPGGMIEFKAAMELRDVAQSITTLTKDLQNMDLVIRSARKTPIGLPFDLAAYGMSMEEN
jgi:hypothetical protein